MKKLFIVLVLLLFAAPAMADGTDWFRGTFKEALAKAAKEDKLVLIDFYSDG